MLLLRPHTASDLADCNPFMRGALAQVVHGNNGVKRTRDLTRQGRELVVSYEVITSPILMVGYLHLLDESGSAKSQE